MMDDTSEHVTDAELDEVERLDREATPGPWSPGDKEEGDELTVYDASDAQTGAVATCERREPAATADAAFIATARILLPRACRELRRYRRPVADVEADVERLAIEVGNRKEHVSEQRPFPMPMVIASRTAPTIGNFTLN